jgi:hypothetical protein
MERLPFGTPAQDVIFLHRQQDAFATLNPGKPNPYGETEYSLSLPEAIVFRDLMACHAAPLGKDDQGSRSVYKRMQSHRKPKSNAWRGGRPE